MAQKEFDDLVAQIAKNEDVEASAKVLIDGFAARLAAAGNDPAKLTALRNELAASSDALASAVAANTEAGPTPPPTV